MFHPGERLFCYKLPNDRGWLGAGQGYSTDTPWTLLGLGRGEAAGVESPVCIKPVLDRLVGHLATNGPLESAAGEAPSRVSRAMTTSCPVA
jgi:hypothetical protein